MLSITGPLSSFLCYPVLCSIFLLPPLFLPSPCNKSQPVYNPLGPLHNYSGSDCRSIYITQCRELASLMEVCVSSECLFHNLTAWVQVLLGLIDVRLSVAGPAWVCSIKWSFARSGQRHGGLSNKLRICGWREKAAIHLLTGFLRVGLVGCVAFWQHLTL